MASVGESSVHTLSAPITPTTPRSLRADERYIKGKIWQRIGNQSAYRRRTDSSPAWAHGDVYIRPTRPTEPHILCDYCNTSIKPQSNHSPYNFARHLKRAHRIAYMKDTNDMEEEEEEETSEAIDSSILVDEAPRQFAALYTTLNIDKFRCLLVRLFVQSQLPYILIEQPEFRQLLLYIQPSIGRYLPESRNTISNWIVDEFQQGQAALRDMISQAKSRVHLSFDIWTSPAQLPILGVCAHFVDSLYQLKHPLLGLKYIEGAHTGSTMAEIVGGLMQEYGIEDRWGVCVTDNAGNNKTCCEALVSRLRPDEDISGRWSRCYGHIVNLAAKAFIYGVKHEDFLSVAETISTQTARNEDAVLAEFQHWRKMGSFGKFHNVVKHIRASAQRRQRFDTLLMACIRNIDGIDGTENDLGVTDDGTGKSNISVKLPTFGLVA